MSGTERGGFREPCDVLLEESGLEVEEAKMISMCASGIDVSTAGGAGYLLL